jgi:hypothetical protein
MWAIRSRAAPAGGLLAPELTGTAVSGWVRDSGLARTKEDYAPDEHASRIAA